ncbi:MAG TPA: SDR family oxidoreductase [Polyangiaceae bacterium]|jgi:NAD(P)-dependent dehydrogenase (short-subunit alcohol dehydrogenase family)
MQAKTVVVTGANQGIGKAAAVALAAKGARVVLVARNREKGERARAEVEAAGAGGAELVVADLSSQAEVRRAAAEIKRKHDRLDVLVNNAGVFVPERHATADGLEETFALNHLGYFLLTRELLELLRESGASRIVNVSSEAHRGARMHWDDLQFERSKYGGFKAYGQSKLANVLFTYELARRLEGTKVTANCLHPGVIGSGFGQTYGGAMSVLVKIARPFMLTPEEGARTTVYLASSPDVEGVSGKYFSKCKPVRSNALSYDEPSQHKLWALSEELVKVTAQAA